MRDFAKKFYKGKAWQSTRKAYFKKCGGLCEKCLKRGEVVPGEIVHHKIHLDARTINDPRISLNFDNLELLCRKCHALEHPEIYGNKKKRYRVEEDGSITILENENEILK